MIFLTFLTALSIASVAAYYSIIGLTAIFAGSFWPIVIMASVLECGKLVTASWLYRNWKLAPFLLKTYLTIAVVVLMIITSMGIFGFLSKAHLEQTISIGGNNDLRIESLERRVETERKRISDAETVIAQLDTTVETLIEFDRIRGPDGAVATREAQAPERERLNNEIDQALDRIEEYQDELLPLKQATIALEAEVGPLKYIADLIYGEDESASRLDQAVRWITLLLVSVFDPLAVLLLIAANMSLKHSKEMKVRAVKAEAPLQKTVDELVENVFIKDKVVELTPVEVDSTAEHSLAFTKLRSNKVVIDEDRDVVSLD